MSEKNEHAQSHTNSEDSKEKFREALERKKKSGGIRNNNTTNGPKISGGQSGGNAPKMFRRKSGSA
jgi:hypothetical protein